MRAKAKSSAGPMMLRKSQFGLGDGSPGSKRTWSGKGNGSMDAQVGAIDQWAYEEELNFEQSQVSQTWSWVREEEIDDGESTLEKRL